MHETKIEMKLHEEMKPLEEICKKMSEELAACIDTTREEDIPAVGQVVDMIKDLCEAKEKIAKTCYYKKILASMEKSEEEDKEEEKYFLKMLKEERGEELKRMQEEYGEDEGERRFYDNYRWANGRFAPKGRGTYSPRRGGRRGYEEKMPMPMEYIMGAEGYMMYPAEYWRDMDRKDRNRMYYGGGSGNSNSGGSSSGSSGSSYGGNSGGNSGSSSGNMGGNSGGSVRGYSDGYNDGYQEGERNGRNSQSRDRREGRSGQSRRSYMETKETNKDGSMESKQKRMKELDSYMNELNEDMKDLIQDMTPEERNMMKQKVAKLATLV